MTITPRSRPTTRIDQPQASITIVIAVHSSGIPSAEPTSRASGAAPRTPLPVHRKHHQPTPYMHRHWGKDSPATLLIDSGGSARHQYPRYCACVPLCVCACTGDFQRACPRFSVLPHGAWRMDRGFVLSRLSWKRRHDGPRRQRVGFRQYSDVRKLKALLCDSVYERFPGVSKVYRRPRYLGSSVITQARLST